MSRSPTKREQVCPPTALERYIVYDGECPFCSKFTELLRLQRAIGPVALIDARSGAPEVKHLIEQGYNLDEGMVFVEPEGLYQGDECLHRLALLTSPSDFANRLVGRIFRSRRASRLLYPVLRFGRNTVLRLLGRTNIHRT